MNHPRHTRTRGWLPRLREFATDERGTSMTEFVITLPVMILIFAGIVELGEVSRRSVKNWAKAHRDVFAQSQAIQVATFEETVNNITRGDEYLPGIAGWTATEQLADHPPNQKNRIVRGVVTAAEAATYSVGTDTMAHRGHLGEAVGRTLPTRPWASLIGVEDAVNSSSGQFVGRRERRSVLTQSLVVDAFQPSQLNGGAGCSNAFSQATTALNSALSASGVRPALAAGIRYGTVTGTSPQESVEIGGRIYNFNAHFAMTLPPHVYPEGQRWMRQAATVAIARFAMADCRNAPYQRLLGVFSHHPDPDVQLSDERIKELKLPSNWGDWALQAPTLEEAQLSWPLDYGHESETN